MARITNKAGTSTIGSQLKVQFSKEVATYASLLKKALSGETMFGSEIKMPSTNLVDIKRKFIDLGTKELKEQGVKLQRAKSIATYTFDKLLEEEMHTLEN